MAIRPRIGIPELVTIMLLHAPASVLSNLGLLQMMAAARVDRFSLVRHAAVRVVCSAPLVRPVGFLHCVVVRTGDFDVLVGVGHVEVIRQLSLSEFYQNQKFAWLRRISEFNDSLAAQPFIVCLTSQR